MTTMTSTKLRVGGLAAAAALVVGITGCAVPGTAKITSDTSCHDYFNFPADVRHDAAIKISVDVHSSDPGNPMWGLNTDAACGSNPNATVGQVLGQRR